MISLGDSKFVDGLLHINELDPFSTLSANPYSSRTTSTATTRRAPNLDTTAESLHNDPFGSFEPLTQAHPLHQSGVARSTFEVLDGSLNRAPGYGRCRSSALMPLSSLSNAPAPSMASSFNSTPARRTMPGNFFEEDSDPSMIEPATKATTPRSPKHHMNAETSLLMAELNIGDAEAEIYSYVVEVALRSDLPPPWKKKVDQLGATYYVDVDNETSTWTSPLLPYLKQVIEAGRMYFKKPTAKYFEQTKSTLWRAHVKELEGWHGPLKDQEGHSYFWNSETERSTWHDPRLSAQFYYDLQSSLLKHLETLLTAAQDTDDCPFDASKGPPWEIRPVGKFTARGDNAASAVPEPISPNDQLMLVDQPQPARHPMIFALGEKAMRVKQSMEASFNHKEQTFLMHKMSNTADWARSAAEAEETVQRRRLNQKRVQKLEEKKVRDGGRDIAEMIHDPAVNAPSFLGTAPLEIREPWIADYAPLENVKPWQMHQPRYHVGWQPWELWTKERPRAEYSEAAEESAAAKKAAVDEAAAAKMAAEQAAKKAAEQAAAEKRAAEEQKVAEESAAAKKAADNEAAAAKMAAEQAAKKAAEQAAAEKKANSFPLSASVGWLQSKPARGFALIAAEGSAAIKKVADDKAAAEKMEAEEAAKKAAEQGVAQKEAIGEQKAAAAYKIELDKRVEGSHIGISFDKDYTITKIKDGLVRDWNATAAPGKQVCVGDRIVRVNGKTSVAEMSQECKGSHILSIKLRRSSEGEATPDMRANSSRSTSPVSPKTKMRNQAGPALKASPVYEIELDKRAEGSRIGIGFDKDYTITKIKDGLMSEWNATAAPEKQVCIGDRIIEINGKTAVDEMQQQCMLHQILSMRLRRPEPLKAMTTLKHYAALVASASSSDLEAIFRELEPEHRKQMELICQQLMDKADCNAGHAQGEKQPKVEAGWSEPLALTRGRRRTTPEAEASLVYEIELDKRAEGSHIGIGFDKDFTITKMKDGLVSEWNATAAPNKRVCIGDRIIETNGKTGVDDMQRECKQKQVLSMKLRRPRLLEVRSSDCSQQDSLGIVRHRFFHKPSVATWLSVAP